MSWDQWRAVGPEPEPEPDDPWSADDLAPGEKREHAQHEAEVREAFERFVSHWLLDAKAAARTWELEPWQERLMEALVDGRYRHWILCIPRGAGRPRAIDDLLGALRVNASRFPDAIRDRDALVQRLEQAHERGNGTLVIEVPLADAERFGSVSEQRRTEIMGRLQSLAVAMIAEHAER